MSSQLRFLTCVTCVALTGTPASAQQAAAPAEGSYGAPLQETAAPDTPTGGAQPAPLASTDGEQPGLRVEVTELKRAGNIVTLKFMLINESSEAFSFEYGLGDPAMSAADYNAIGGVHLIDNEGRKKYQVIRDANQNCVCSKGLGPVQPEARMTLWARFPAPPPEVETVSVMIPHFIPMDGVPLSQ
jgi:hypothetical protein